MTILFTTLVCCIVFGTVVAAALDTHPGGDRLECLIVSIGVLGLAAITFVYLGKWIL
jgi:hypothetical protein